MLMIRLFCLLSALALTVKAQTDLPPSTFPHVYPGQPDLPYSQEWQEYFEVKKPLPNITFTLPTSYAGSISVDRYGHPNDTLFFWAWEKYEGSLTDCECTNDPWGIWLNGGLLQRPGVPSTLGLLVENGPMIIQDDYSTAQNEYSWNKVLDIVYVDNPVGVGYSTADSTGYADGEDQVAEDFVGFLGNLVKVFPCLSTRPLVLMGESYAGTYIPYIMKQLFQAPEPPVQLTTAAIGNGEISNITVASFSLAVSIIETYPQVIGYDPEVLEYFRSQQHLCKYDVNLSYPQTGGKLQTFREVSATDKHSPYYFNYSSSSSKFSSNGLRSSNELSLLMKRTLQLSSQRQHDRNRNHALETVKRQWKRDLSLRTNGSIDSWYGCFQWYMLDDYMTNFTYPWTTGSNTMDPYYIPDALTPKPLDSVTGTFPGVANFLNDWRIRKAIHAPFLNWTEAAWYPFGNVVANMNTDPSPAPAVFWDELVANASSRGIKIVLYSGNDDILIPHRGYEILIQNTTFGGIQGFTRAPSTKWYDDSGAFAGIVHQERGITYILVDGAGHTVPATKPRAAYTLLREFIVGQNQTGLVVDDGQGHTFVIGGESSDFPGGIMRGQEGIYMGSYSTTATFTYPSETISAWNSFVETAAAN